MEQIFDWKRLLITIGIVILTASVVGGTTWYVMGEQVKKEREESEKRIDEILEKAKNTNKSTPEKKESGLGSTTNTKSANLTDGWKTEDSLLLGLTFKYPSDYFFKNLLQNPELAILISDKKITRDSVTDFHYAPITIQHIDSNVGAGIDPGTMTNIKNSQIMIDGEVATVSQANYSLNPHSSVKENTIKVIKVPSKKIRIVLMDAYGGAKSDYTKLSLNLDLLISTIKFK